MSNLTKIYKDKELLEFFRIKIFEVFLREYSIRRNLKKGTQSINDFIDNLFENNFIERVKNGENSIIDDLSDKNKSEESFTNGKSTKSLLSKIAFLTNPNHFSLYDNLAKKSIYNLYKNDKNHITHSKLEDYTEFIEQSIILRKEIHYSNLFNNSKKILLKFQNTEANNYFLENNDAFEIRIIDKLLWVLEQNFNGKGINNIKYYDFYKIK